ncbi:MAG: hypothetical protein Q7U54_00630 [Bacteroidales bacterium]|nr:hypothetical protein [Bacteroidales bacterium]
MKVPITILFFLIATIAIQAQTNPELVVIEMPVITINVCKKEIREQFLKKVDKLKAEVAEEITRRKTDSKKGQAGFDEQAAKNMSNQAGIPVSNADMQKMKNATKEEKQAMAMAMMNQNMNMPVDEAKKASKMSKEGQTAYGEAMSTEMMADAQANPDKNKAAQKNNMSMSEMAMEQSQLAQKIQLKSQKFDEQLIEFNKLKAKTKVECDTCIAKIDREFANKENHTLGDEYYESIKLQKETCYQIYCGFLTPKYNTILLERFNTIVALGDDYNRMDVLENELASATSGSKKEISEPGLKYLEALMDYMVHLEELP